MSRDGYEDWDSRSRRRSGDDSDRRGGRRRSRHARTQAHDDSDAGQDRYEYGAQDDYSQPGGYDPSNGYGSPNGYGQSNGYSDGYGQDAAYGEPGYGQSGDYRHSGGYSQPDANGYGQSDPYGPPGGYADSDGYTSSPGYADSRGVTDPYGYSDSQGYQDPPGRADSYGRSDQHAQPYAYDDQPAGYGSQSNYDDHLYDQGDSFADSGSFERGYGAPAGFEHGGGYVDDEYGQDSRSGRQGRRRSRHPADALDADDDRHSGFFSGFSSNDDDHYGRQRRPPRKRRGGAGTIALILVLAVLGGIGFTGYHFYSLYKQRHAVYTGSGYGSVLVRVQSGDSADTIAPQLLRLGVIAAIDPWDAYVATKPSTLQPGEYKLHKHMSPQAAWAMLSDSKSRIAVNVTIVDGVRWSKFLPKLAQESGIPLAQFQQAINSPKLGLPSYAKGNPEGYLYPDTYNVSPGETALAILQAAVKEFKTKTAQINLASRAAAVHLSPAEVITGASLLEAEVGPKYYRDVARVIDNRLNANPPMKLQLDSTIAYATNKNIYNLTTSDLSVQSPYNTRLHAGMPPGPIDSPDVAAIQAFLHPAPDTFTSVYFVTVSCSGTTKFTSDYGQFTTWSHQAQQTLSKCGG